MMWPASGMNRVATSLTRVDLPEPLGAQDAEDLPASHPQADVVEGEHWSLLAIATEAGQPGAIPLASEGLGSMDDVQSHVVHDPPP